MSCVSDPRRIFIIGPGRSGTSLMHSLLESHGDISCLPETQFLRTFVLSRPTKFQHKNDLYLEAPRIGRLDDLFNDITLKWPISASIIYEKLVLAAQRKTGCGLIVDKDPRLIESVSSLLVRYPDARVICMHRDPGDILLSKQKAGWSGKRHWVINMYVTHLHMLMLNQYENNHIKNLASFEYETLTSDLKSTVGNICEFIDVRFDEKMLRHNDYAHRLISEDEKAWKNNLTKSVFLNSKKWKGKLKPFQIISIKFLLMKTADYSRYSSEYRGVEDGVNFLMRAILWIAAELLHLVAITHFTFIERRVKMHASATSAGI